MTLPTTMRALRQLSLDGPADMELVEAPVPSPGPGEVLIRVAAAGVNVADLSRAHGTFGDDGPRPPFPAGFEAAGEVVAHGAAVTAPAIGARVVGVGEGAFAEYTVLPAAAAMPVPPGWTARQAPGLAVNWPTALAVVGPLGGVTAGQTVLVHAAAGATGRAAAVVARHRGARVIGAASRDKHAAVLARGADHVVDSRADDLAAEVLALTDGAGVDVVLESAGGPTFAASLAVAKRVTGRVVVLGLPGGDAALTNRDLVYRHQVHVVGFNLGVLIRAAPQVFGEVMGELSALVDRGVIRPEEPTAYALADGRKALADLEARATTGKLVLVP
jgi:NADPH:quinone reductase